MVQCRLWFDMLLVQENFLHAVHSTSVLTTQKTDTLTCAVSNEQFRPLALTLKKHSLTLVRPVTRMR